MPPEIGQLRLIRGQWQPMNKFIRQHKENIARNAANKPRRAKEGEAKALPSKALPVGADNEFGVWLASAKMDWDRMKAIPDHSERNKLKPALIKKYRDVIESYKASGATHENAVLAMNIIWSADCSDWKTLLVYADLANDTKQSTMLIKRDLPTFATDALLQAETKAADKYIGELLHRIDSGQWTVNHPLKAKLYKRAGKLAEATDDIAKAVECYAVADKTYPNVGVKTRLAELKKQLADTPDSAPKAGA